MKLTGFLLIILGLASGAPVIFYLGLIILIWAFLSKNNTLTPPNKLPKGEAGVNDLTSENHHLEVNGHIQENHCRYAQFDKYIQNDSPRTFNPLQVREKAPVEEQFSKPFPLASLPPLSDDQKVLYNELIMPQPKSVLVTGPAGTGKTTLLYSVQTALGKHSITLAPTGMAALQARGQTIHSFFKFPARLIRIQNREDIRLPKRGSSLHNIICALETLIIDEISMVRVDILDAINWFLKQVRESDQAFGGVKVILFGDLYQLGPIVRHHEEQAYIRHVWGGPFFFNARVWKESVLNVHVLKQIHRQKTDPVFVSLLNQLRQGDLRALDALNETRVKPEGRDEPGVVILTPRKREAEEVNLGKLHSLPGETFIYEATIQGEIGEKDFPTERVLILKKGAQVILLKNDIEEYYFNGDLGWVEELGKDYVAVRLRRTNDIVYVESHIWEKVAYKWNPEVREIEPSIVGSFQQLPLRLAWAMTIHKAQGLTLDRVHLELGERGMFAHGQLYVALTRVRSLADLSLSRPIRPGEVIWDTEISRFEEKINLEGRWYLS